MTLTKFETTFDATNVISMKKLNEERTDDKELHEEKLTSSLLPHLSECCLLNEQYLITNNLLPEEKPHQPSTTTTTTTTTTTDTASSTDTPLNGVSLQDAFLKFKKIRQHEILQVKAMKNKHLHCKTDPMKVQQLRDRFLETAKTYIGIPYAKKYCDAATPAYMSPLFLDCCGLVRRVVRDLRDCFKFNIGPWNQAYMFDTLPNKLEVTMMKPGDLVFVSGVYNRENAKQQLHNIVHVEIWLGEGIKTIGARWKKSHVEIHESYQYVSSIYHSMQYHFRSIDTWLSGICTSVCPDHVWKRKSVNYNPSKFSIFSVEGIDDVPAEDSDCDDEFTEQYKSPLGEQYNNNNSVTDQTMSTPVCEQLASHSQHETLLALEHLDIDELEEDRLHFHSDDQTMIGVVDTTTVCMNYITDDPITNNENQYQPQDGNGDEKRASGQQSTTSDSVEKPSAKHSGKSVSPGGSRNSGDGESRRRDEGSNNPSQFPSIVTQLRGISQPTFYLGEGNNAALIEKPLLERGWVRVTDRTSTDFTLKWVQCKSAINYTVFKEGDQLVNHIPNINLLTTKIGLLESLRDYDRVLNRMTQSSQKPYNGLKMADFFPETYILARKDDRETFLETYRENEVWICKPTGLNQGKGIFLISSMHELEEKLSAIDSNGKKRSMERIIQRYMKSPLLIKGRKFDIRSYVLISSTSPFMVFYADGYVRLTIDQFDINCLNLMAHLNNQYIQKKHPIYQEVKEDTVWSFDQLNTYINEQVAESKSLPQDWFYSTCVKKMKEIMLHVFMSVKNKLQQRRGFFDLLGCDFMIDDDMNVIILEMNVNPALHTNCQMLNDVIPAVVEETLNLSIEIWEKVRRSQSITPLQMIKVFSMIYNGANPRRASVGLGAGGGRRSISPGKSQASRPSLPTL